MSIDRDPLAMSLAMLKSALLLLDELGESDAAAKVQHAVSVLTREPIPSSVAEAQAAIEALTVPLRPLVRG